MMQEQDIIKLSNGKDLHIGHADFQHALDLKDAIFKELADQKIDIPGVKDLNFNELSKAELTPVLLETIIKSVLNLDSSKEITRSVFECLKRCTYNKEKITHDTFNDIEIRKFYMQIKYEVIKKNILPFFQNLASLSEKVMGAVKEMGSQK